MQSLLVLVVVSTLVLWCQGQRWGVNCPFDGTTWTHAESGETLQVERHCLDDSGRCYFLHVPDCVPAADSPLVMVLHGRSGCPFEVDDSTRWGRLADQECFVTAYPEGNRDFDLVETSCWEQNGGLETPNGSLLGILPIVTPNCCCTPDYVDSSFLTVPIPVGERRTGDEQFLRRVAQDVTERVSQSAAIDTTIDTKRIYFAGHSNGCIMAMGMAMTNSDMVAGVACHASMLIKPPASDYDPVPIFMAHGLLDEDFRYEPRDFVVYALLGKEKELEYLGDFNECDATVLVDEDTYEADSARLMTRDNCRNDATVQLLVIDNAGHFPMKGEFRGDREDNPNIIPINLDTTAIGWEFIRHHSKSQAPDLNAGPAGGATSAPPLTGLLLVISRIGNFIQQMLTF